MSNCEYCGKESSHTLRNKDGAELFTCKDCYINKRKEFKNKKIRLVHTDMRLLK